MTTGKTLGKRAINGIVREHHHHAIYLIVSHQRRQFTCLLPDCRGFFRVRGGVVMYIPVCAHYRGESCQWSKTMQYSILLLRAACCVYSYALMLHNTRYQVQPTTRIPNFVSLGYRKIPGKYRNSFCWQKLPEKTTKWFSS